MIVFLAAFTVFNAVLALAALQRAIRLGAATWTGSPRLRAIALFTAWTLPFLCVGSTAAGWLKAGAEPHWAAPAVLAPLGWLIVMGLFFAIVDFAEDGAGTRITLTWEPLDASPEEEAFFASMMASMEGGWSGSFEQLDAFLA